MVAESAAEHQLLCCRFYFVDGRKPCVETNVISLEMCLKECGLTQLETRTLRGDQIEVSKILNGYENIDRNICCRLSTREGLEDMELH